MSLDAVEIKVNVATSDIQQAITELELADESSMYRGRLRKVQCLGRVSMTLEQR